mgnify:CR=1 FL=1
MSKSRVTLPATQGDLDDLVAAFVTAMREELKGFATKEDLKKLATKEDLKKLETKLDLVKIDVSDTRRRVRDLEGSTANSEQVRNHEFRIKKLENQVFAQV